MASETALVHAEMARLKSTADDVIANSRAAAAKLQAHVQGDLMPQFRGDGAVASMALSSQIDSDLAKIHQNLQAMSDQVQRTDTMHQATDASASQSYRRLHGMLNG